MESMEHKKGGHNAIEHCLNYKVIGEGFQFSSVRHHISVRLSHSQVWCTNHKIWRLNTEFESRLPRPLLLIGSCNPHDLVDEKVARIVPN